MDNYESESQSESLCKLPTLGVTGYVRFGSFELDLKRQYLFRNGSQVQLQNRAFQVLVILLEAQGEIVTREELRKRLWPTDYVDYQSNLNTTIYKLRRALRDPSALATPFVENIPRRGYRFTGNLTFFDKLHTLPTTNCCNSKPSSALTTDNGVISSVPAAQVGDAWPLVLGVGVSVWTAGVLLGIALTSHIHWIRAKLMP